MWNAFRIKLVGRAGTLLWTHTMTDTNESNHENRTLNVEPVREVDAALPITTTTRVYFSSYHFWAAEHFAELATNLENAPGKIPRFDIQHRAYVTSAILSIVAFLEATINELYKDVADAHPSYISSIDTESRRLIQAFWQLTEERNRSPFSILDKYQMVLTFCRKEQFLTGASPYQDTDLVIKLRNELMHYKPESYGGEAQHKFLKQLRGKFSENPLMTGAGNPYFPDHCLGSGCATWAVFSAKKFADEFFERLKMSPNYRRVTFK